MWSFDERRGKVRKLHNDDGLVLEEFPDLQHGPIVVRGCEPFPVMVDSVGHICCSCDGVVVVFALSCEV